MKESRFEERKYRLTYTHSDGGWEKKSLKISEWVGKSLPQRTKWQIFHLCISQSLWQLYCVTGLPSLFFICLILLLQKKGGQETVDNV